MNAISEVPGGVDWLHIYYFAPRGSMGPTGNPVENSMGPTGNPMGKSMGPTGNPMGNSMGPTGDDAALISKMRRSKGGTEFDRLWSGDAGSDPSSADFRLCCVLAFWTDKATSRMDSLFRQSGLFRNEGRAEKWDRKHHADGRTYGQATIDKAVQATQETYQGNRSAAGRGRVQASAKVETGVDGPLIRIVAGELPAVAEKCMAALIKSKAQIYKRGAALVWPLVIEKPRVNKTGEIPAGALILEPIDESRLVCEVTRAARLEKFDARSKEWVRVDCPPRVAKTILSMPDRWGFPVLSGILEAPCLRPDGSLLTTPGYDPATGLYLHASPGLIVRVPDHPTRDDAIQSLQVLQDVLTDFEFASQADNSVAVAMLLTALVRRWLRTSPGFGLDASTPGSGKTLLADLAALLATGRPAPILNQGLNDEETEKRLGSFLLQGHGLLNLDNIERPLSGELICSLLTSPEVTVRVLGESRSPAVQTNLLFLATGNNLCVKGDLTRRMLICRIDPKCERPEERTFTRNLYHHLPKHRGKLIEAGLTILRAFHRGGLPDQGVKPYGGFEEWSQWIRAAVVWLGMVDPCQTRARLEGSDHVTGELSAVLAIWHRELGEQKLTVRGVIGQCELSTHSALKSALLDVAATARAPNQIDPRRLSHWLRKIQQRVIGKLWFEQSGTVEGRPLWRVTQSG